MSCIFNMRRLLFMEKEQIFDRRKNFKLKGSWRCNLNVSLFAASTSVAGVFTKESESVTLINGRKYFKIRRVIDRSPSHRRGRGGRILRITWFSRGAKWDQSSPTEYKGVTMHVFSVVCILNDILDYGLYWYVVKLNFRRLINWKVALTFPPIRKAAFRSSHLSQVRSILLHFPSARF